MLLATLYAYPLQSYFGKYHVMGAMRITTSIGCTNDYGDHAMLDYYTMWVPIEMFLFGDCVRQYVSIFELIVAECIFLFLV